MDLHYIATESNSWVGETSKFINSEGNQDGLSLRKLKEKAHNFEAVKVALFLKDYVRNVDSCTLSIDLLHVSVNRPS